MTSAEAKKLKAGDRVIFRGDPPMAGKVVSNRRLLIELLWQDGSMTVARHDQLDRIEKSKEM
jgi:hypothetical protein